MNRLAKHNYAGETHFYSEGSKDRIESVQACALFSAWINGEGSYNQILRKWNSVEPIATRNKLSLPKPSKVLCSCGKPVKPIAFDTGDGWFLGWDCENKCEDFPDGMLNFWPFNEDLANWRDLELAGFEVL